TLTATDPGLVAAPSGTFTISANVAHHLAYQQQPSSATAGATLNSVQIQVRDQFDNLVSTDTSTVTVSIGTNPGGGTLSGTTTVAASGGVASFSTLSIDKAGVGYTLVASDGSLGIAPSTAFTISAATADHLAFGTQPGTTTAGSPITPAVAVRVVDA